MYITLKLANYIYQNKKLWHKEKGAWKLVWSSKHKPLVNNLTIEYDLLIRRTSAANKELK